MPQSTKDLGRLRNILAALEEEERRADGLGTVESADTKDSTCINPKGAIGSSEEEESSPSPTRAHTTYSHFVKEHLQATNENNIATNNTAATNHSTNNAANAIDYAGSGGDQPSSSMLSQELARLMLPHESQHGP